MNLKSFIRIFFEEKETFEQLDPDTKAKYLFMFNQYTSRAFPVNVDLLNRKHLNDKKDLVMDIWAIYFKRNLSAPDWFEPDWSKLRKKKSEGLLKNFSDIDKKILSLMPDLLNEVKEDIENKKLFGSITSKKLKKKK
jgi:hypothetical protein